MAFILVIDDDPDIRELLKSTLESAGHEVVLAADGREGARLSLAREAFRFEEGSNESRRAVRCPAYAQLQRGFKDRSSPV